MAVYGQRQTLRERMRVALRRARVLWRRVRHRCILCGKPNPVDHRVQCKALWHVRYPQLCHRCGKGVMYGELYGMGRHKLEQMLKGKTDG